MIKKRVLPLVDRILALTISKKLTVWVVGVILEMTKDIGISTNFLILSGIYLSIQGIWDIVHTRVKMGTGDSFGGEVDVEDINFEK